MLWLDFLVSTSKAGARFDPASSGPIRAARHGSFLTPRRSLRRGLVTDELSPGELGSLACRAKSGLAQKLAHSGRRKRGPETAELTGDPRAAWAPPRVCPAPRHELAMPAQKRVGTDEQRAPALARKQTAGGGKECSIRRAQLESRCLATKNLELVAEHHDLELLELLRTAPQQDQREHASESEIDECDQARPPRTGSVARLYGRSAQPATSTRRESLRRSTRTDRVCAPHRLRSSLPRPSSPFFITIGGPGCSCSRSTHLCSLHSRGTGQALPR